MFGISAIGLIGSLITATIGAVIVLWLVSVFSRPRGD
ncbi:GlsB/YeaQ/YmgE family stress response membrane protein [Parabacteroides chinchillae]|uniref:Transglycosylase associated protein n=1 Tax=Parabacteroides chinchillae TaxID=871327 RepID=A0A8G2BYC5_9BACT|nr:Transglycosylase associated protein [Parabacteroides chinchillae]